MLLKNMTNHVKIAILKKKTIIKSFSIIVKRRQNLQGMNLGRRRDSCSQAATRLRVSLERPKEMTLFPAYLSIFQPSVATGFPGRKCLKVDWLRKGMEMAQKQVERGSQQKLGLFLVHTFFNSCYVFPCVKTSCEKLHWLVQQTLSLQALMMICVL